MFGNRSYKNYLLGNIGHIILVGAPAAGLIWMIAYAKDKYVERNSETVKHKLLVYLHAPLMHNFVDRFIYEVYFEVCLCIMISLTNPCMTNTELVLASVLTITLAIYTIYVIKSTLRIQKSNMK